VQQLVLTMFVAVAGCSFAALQFPGARLLKFIPELLSAVVLIYVVLKGAQHRFAFIAPKYWLLIAGLTLVIICGVVSGGAAPAPMISELRFYVRAAPFFLLPAVVAFTEPELRQQLKWLMWLGIFQLPVAAFQRWQVWSQGRFSGDAVHGTIPDSGTLTIFLLSSAFVASGLFLRGQLGKARYFALMLALFLPTTINETKVTVIYLPLGLLVVFALGSEPDKRLRVLARGLVLTLVFAGIFLPVYSYFEAPNPYAKLSSVAALASNPKYLQGYLSSGVRGIGTKKDVRRGDAIRVPAEYLARDPIRLILGLGLGSVSPSATLGKNFQGAYYSLFRPFLITSFTIFLLDIGMLGITLVVLLNLFVFRDALALANKDRNVISGLATGWTAVTLIMLISLVYSTIHLEEALAYPYWYFSGILAAQRVRSGRVNVTRVTKGATIHPVLGVGGSIDCAYDSHPLRQLSLSS
jgi:hypothetical protein